MHTGTIQDAIREVSEGRSLSQELAAASMESMMSGEATPAQMAALLIGLKMKGETATEIAGLARVMRSKALRVTSRWPDLVDNCSTGGSGRQAFNVSTA